MKWIISLASGAALTFAVMAVSRPSAPPNAIALVLFLVFLYGFMGMFFGLKLTE